MKIFENKVAVVTGAGGVLCAAFAEDLAKCGAKVALLDINLEAAEAVAEKLASSGITQKQEKPAQKKLIDLFAGLK